MRPIYAIFLISMFIKFLLPVIHYLKYIKITNLEINRFHDHQLIHILNMLNCITITCLINRLSIWILSTILHWVIWVILKNLGLVINKLPLCAKVLFYLFYTAVTEVDSKAANFYVNICKYAIICYQLHEIFSSRFVLCYHEDI